MCGRPDRLEKVECVNALEPVYARRTHMDIIYWQGRYALCLELIHTAATAQHKTGRMASLAGRFENSSRFSARLQRMMVSRLQPPHPPQKKHRPRPPCQGDAVSLAAARSASPRFPVSEQATTTSRERHSTAGSGQPGPPTCLCRTARAAVTWASRRPPPPPPWQNGGARRPAVTATTLLFPRGFEARTRSLCAISSWSLSSTLCGAVVG